MGVLGDKIFAGIRRGKESRTDAIIQWIRGRKYPRQNAVLSGLWTYGSKWAPFSFFRLFCIFQNMHTETREGSRFQSCWVKEYFQSRTWQGQQHLLQFSYLHLIIFPESPLKELNKFDRYRLKRRHSKKLTDHIYQNSIHKIEIITYCTPFSNVWIKFAVRSVTSCNNLEWFLFNSKFSLAIFSAANIKIVNFDIFDDWFACWSSIRLTSLTRRSATSFAWVTSALALNVCVFPKSSMVTISSNTYWSLPFRCPYHAGRYCCPLETSSSLTSKPSIFDRIKAFSSA